MLGAQPVNSFSRKGMLVDVATDDQYGLVGLKGWQRRSLGGDQTHWLRRKGRMRAEPFDKRRPFEGSGPERRTAPMV